VLIDDWLVPIILQSGEDIAIRNRELLSGETDPGAAYGNAQLPPPPKLGFVGSDDALLAVDRAFDQSAVVLLYGLAGAGKTAAAVEFGKWYEASNRTTQRVLFSSFEDSPALEDLLGVLEPVVGRPDRGVDWRDPLHQQQAARRLAELGCLWIWDNVETLEHLPVGTRKELQSFLKQSSEMGVKFLLTARGTEESWLDQTTLRVGMPPLRGSEAIEFAARLVARSGQRAWNPEVLWPILEFAAGNPLTLQVALATFFAHSEDYGSDSVQLFAKRLRENPIVLNYGAGNSRSRSLLASLRYGFDQSFSPDERRRLALVSLFRRYANTNVLFLMGHRPVDPAAVGLPDHDFSWTLPELEAETPGSLEQILTKATHLGLLTKSATNHFWLHPAIHLYLRSTFDSCYASANQASAAQQAFAEAVGVFAIVFTQGYGHGARESTIDALMDEEENLRHALQLGHTHGWPQAEIGALHGLSTLLLHQGRTGQWASVLESVYADFVGQDFGPVAGTEKWWSFVLDQRLRLAMGAGEIDLAEKMARRILDHERVETQTMDRMRSDLSPGEEKKLQYLAIATGRLADILRDKGSSESIALNEEALKIYDTIADRVGRAVRFLNLGHIYKNIPHLEDLDLAAEYYSKALDLYWKEDGLAQAQCLGQLGAVCLKRLEKEKNLNAPGSLASHYVEMAIEYYQRARELLPEDAHLDLGIVHNQLGASYRFFEEEFERAVSHFRQASKQVLLIGRTADCAGSRANTALLLMMMKRPEEAVAAAAEALEEFRSVDYRGPIMRQLEKIIGTGGKY
jgi:tetratricopeptide (TPR) repeat protein